MKNIIIAIFILTISSCKAQVENKEEIEKIVQELAKENINKSSKDSLINCFHNLVFGMGDIKKIDSFKLRVWYSSTFGKVKNFLIEISSLDSKWNLKQYLYDYKYYDSLYFNLPTNVQNIVNRDLSIGEINELKKSLIDNKISSLKDQSNYKDYPIMLDCSGILIELSTKKEYKKVQYSCTYYPTILNKYDEAKKLETFLSFFKLKLNLETGR